jgi:NAD(P)H-dependent FMN reductase
MLKIGIIIGSTRPNRVGESVGNWVFECCRKRSDAEFELIDLKDYDLPLLDEPIPPAMHKYSKDHTKKWAEKISTFDGFIFVTPEYNHATSAALKNALDFLYAEWNNKTAGFVGYGSAYGCRAVENLRLICGELQMADVRNQVMLSLHTDFENYSVFKPKDGKEKQVEAMLDQLIPWTSALKSMREGAGDVKKTAA